MSSRKSNEVSAAAGPFEGLAFRSECLYTPNPNRPIKRNETSDWKLTGMICFDRTGNAA